VTDRDRKRAWRGDPVLYARGVTTGDPSAQQTASQRAAARVQPKKSGSAAAREPRVGSSKSGTVKKRAPRTATPNGEADVLDRLNKLGEAAPVAPALEPMPIALPAIIEADPSFPLPAPSAEQVAAAIAADLAQAPAQSPTGPPAPVATAVDVDIPTEALVSAPAVLPDLFPDRTDVVPAVAPAPAPVPAPAPTEAMPATVIGEDVDGSFGVVLPLRPLQRPVAFRRGKPRVRRVTRVIRHVDTWSVFKVALVFNAILFMVCLTSGVLLWNVANATGTVDNVEKFFEQFGWSSFEFKGGELYHGFWIASLFVAIGLTGLAVFVATVFNLITDLVGGVRVSVLEEEVVARSTMHPGTRVHPVAPVAADEPG
jgi:hypothetical protein